MVEYELEPGEGGTIVRLHLDWPVLPDTDAQESVDELERTAREELARISREA